MTPILRSVLNGTDFASRSVPERTIFMPCQERERLAAAYLAAVTKTSGSGNAEAVLNGNGKHEALDDEAVLLALYDHQIEHGC
jgi:hypothetical protein